MAEVLRFDRMDSDQRRGHRAFVAGQAAEDCAARHFERLGYRVLERRWRGAGAEIDLIVTDGETLVFVEVKASRSFDAAARLLRWGQMTRIFRAAEAYAAGLGGWPPEMRVDAALVDGQGAVRILENVSMAA
ncbi:YraN family protein [Pseudooceanicola sp. CBS1P-1]|uniref:UPF0102 protein GR170_09600 n=1 Tax=Pseudooceanicola albus TaxID=2692189 RepID=A0A6L7G2E9_9RHOB|nr:MULTISPECIES: YraN family protein [Pseudooceanicola]MBT9384916.1 YraN family protein [Pseudooceanicola endophyticus]MXN18089.1 hypothetical protein [Pseudooceanicola albus]